MFGDKQIVLAKLHALAQQQTNTLRKLDEQLVPFWADYRRIKAAITASHICDHDQPQCVQRYNGSDTARAQRRQLFAQLDALADKYGATRNQQRSAKRELEITIMEIKRLTRTKS